MQRTKAWITVLGAGRALVNGATRQIFSPLQAFSEADVCFSLVAVALLFAWYRMDAEEQEFARSPLLNVGVIALTVVAVPYYLMRTRGLRRALYGMGIFLAVAVAYSVLEYAGEYSAYLFKRSFQYSGPIS